MAEKKRAKKRKEEFAAPGAKEKNDKPSKEEYAVAKWLRANVPTKKTKFLNHHVEYFTGSKAIDALLKSEWGTGDVPLFTERTDVTSFLHEMLVHRFFHRAVKVTVSEQELKGRSKKRDTEKQDDKKKDDAVADSQAEGKEGKSETKEPEKRKRKIRLDMHLDQVFIDGPEAYVWIYDPIPLYYWLFGALLVLAAIGICMFPLWPPGVRKGVYYLSVAAACFLILIIALTTLRVIVFCLVWILTLSRHHLWLLPNLTEDVGFFASFWPLYQYEYRGKDYCPPSKSEKGKKKKKKEKCSDDEAEPADEKSKLISKDSQGESDKGEKLDLQSAALQDNTESESESSQRSSTGKDFEIVDAGDVDTS
ncbi:translocation protein 1 [Arctopsyche grandis]|uniref:translocation protein 1 n=1 Tax=Arctopsyche grandis TaxID=121162 RepID=UPI00406D737D